VESIPDSRRISKERQHLKKYPAVAVADCLQIPIRSDSCDAAICVAVLHHLSTYERRKRCIEELVRIVRHGGVVNVQAWSLDQEEGSKRRFASSDVFVPFNVQPKYLSINDADPTKENGGDAISTAQRYSEALNAEFDEKKGLVVFKRYCHLYRQVALLPPNGQQFMYLELTCCRCKYKIHREGEIDGIAKDVEGLEIIDSGFESGNYYLIFRVNKQ
jgi:SAM-dependent methyltransferase